MWLREEEEGCGVALLGSWVGGLLGGCEGCRPWWDLWDHTQEGTVHAQG